MADQLPARSAGQSTQPGSQAGLSETRLSELAGIPDAEEDLIAFWPLNVVLVVLGAAILSIAFYFLDPQDPRWVYNPWTYAIVTPLALVALSAMLSMVVSRMVEKSMQMAFLLSVLVHLLLLIYAMNIVIFSRWWPEIIEITQQRQQLKRQSLQANQYFRPSPASQTGSRPDYLRHVPTEHQPTEMEVAVSPALELARSERSDLVTPIPKVEVSNDPHLIERKQHTPSRSSVTQQTASLSRSELQQLEQIESSPEQMSVPLEAQARRLEAQSTESSRSSSSSSKLAQPLAAKVEPMRRQSTQSRRAEAPTPEPMQLRPSAQSMARSAVSRSRSPISQSPSVPQMQAQLDPQRLVQPPSLSAMAAPSRNRQQTQSLAGPRAAPTNRSPSSRLTLETDRRETRWQVPEPTAGQSTQALARATAGGRAGPPAASSMPVLGPQLLAGQSQQANQQVAPSRTATRTSRAQRSGSASESGLPQAPTWQQQPRLAMGTTGQSSGEMVRAESDGNALSNDVAALTGGGGAIERSRIGAATPLSGPLTAPEPSGGGTSGDDGSVRDAQGLADNANASIRRQSRDSGTGQQQTQSSQQGPLASLQLGPSALGSSSQGSETAGRRGSNLRRAESPGTSEAPNNNAGAARSLARDSGTSAPRSEAIEVPDLSSVAEASRGDRTQPSEGVSESRRQRDGRGKLAAPSNPLRIDAVAGSGGLDNIARRSGNLLARKSGLGDELTPVDLDIQRFARQEVGGPLAAGQQVRIPKPAFQQRLERLKDRNSLDETSAEPQTELAIERGLEFLARYQRQDGSWRLQDFDTEVLMRSDTAATGLSLLAFQGAGYTHQQFKYADVVDRAIQFLVQRQTPTGDLYIRQDPASDQNAWLYSHGIAALALCEAYGMTQDPELREPAQRAIDFMVASQDPTRGGWRYRPGSGSDTSVSGWFMMAFQSGRLAGLDVPQESLDLLSGYLRQSQVSAQQPHLFRYNPFANDTPQQRHGLKPTAVMTSVGLLMQLYAGWKRDRTEMQMGTDYLLQYLPSPGTRDSSKRDTYYWYYATQVMFHMGGDRWQAWHDQLYPMLIENQIITGANAGSWDPMRPTPDLWARYGGRLYVTTMNLLSLEVSYRHLPLYDSTAQ